MWKISASLSDPRLVPEVHTSDTTAQPWVQSRQKGKGEDGITAVRKGKAKQAAFTCLLTLYPPTPSGRSAGAPYRNSAWMDMPPCDSDFLSLNFGMELGFIYLHICCFSRSKQVKTFAIGWSLTIPINSICVLVCGRERPAKWKDSNKFQDWLTHKPQGRLSASWILVHLQCTLWPFGFYMTYRVFITYFWQNQTPLKYIKTCPM